MFVCRNHYWSVLRRPSALQLHFSNSQGLVHLNVLKQWGSRGNIRSHSRQVSVRSDFREFAVFFAYRDLTNRPFSLQPSAIFARYCQLWAINVEQLICQVHRVVSWLMNRGTTASIIAFATGSQILLLSFCYSSTHFYDRNPDVLQLVLTQRLNHFLAILINDGAFRYIIHWDGIVLLQSKMVTLFRSPNRQSSHSLSGACIWNHWMQLGWHQLLKFFQIYLPRTLSAFNWVKSTFLVAMLFINSRNSFTCFHWLRLGISTTAFVVRASGCRSDIFTLKKRIEIIVRCIDSQLTRCPITYSVPLVFWCRLD